jgi:hypothetical protein
VLFTRIAGAVSQVLLTRCFFCAVSHALLHTRSFSRAASQALLHTQDPHISPETQPPHQAKLLSTRFTGAASQALLTVHCLTGASHAVSQALLHTRCFTFLHIQALILTRCFASTASHALLFTVFLTRCFTGAAFYAHFTGVVVQTRCFTHTRCFTGAVSHAVSHELFSRAASHSAAVFFALLLLHALL